MRDKLNVKCEFVKAGIQIDFERCHSHSQ